MQILFVIATVLALPPHAAPHATAGMETCSPLVFPPGSKEEVLSKATEFLTKVETVQEHPYWPGKTSGVTLGIGWDAGYHTEAELRRVWADLGTTALDRLSIAVGKKGAQAKALIPGLNAVRVPAPVSRAVLVNS